MTCASVRHVSALPITGRPSTPRSLSQLVLASNVLVPRCLCPSRTPGTCERDVQLPSPWNALAFSGSPVSTLVGAPHHDKRPCTNRSSTSPGPQLRSNARAVSGRSHSPARTRV